MNTRNLGFLAAAAMAVSLSAHAQLISTDSGAAAVDSNGLMWANTVGTELSWSPTGAAGSAQAWVAGLNASDYGGYNNWTLATGNGSAGANTTTDQIGELFFKDCGNSAGSTSVLNNAGKNCTALSALSNTINQSNAPFNDVLLFSGSLYGTTCCNVYNTFWWSFQTYLSGQGPWNFDTSFNGGLRGDALAVREVAEIDPAFAASGLALLVGGLLVVRGRRGLETPPT